MNKNCEWCGKPFLPKKKINRFCGYSCAAKYIRSLDPPRMKKEKPPKKERKLKRTKRNCQWCGKPITLTYSQACEKKRFCGRSCSAKWRMRQPIVRAAIYTEERSKKISIKLMEAHKHNPDLAKKISIRMTLNNPMQNPKIVEKVKEKWKEFGHPLSRQQLVGGNGRPLPQAQRILWAALGPKWKPEYPINTKQTRNSGYPTCYKADIALPQSKIWIEVDGWGHQIESAKLQDKKKEIFLTTLGWKGLRFSNQEILVNLSLVLSIIYKFLDIHHIMLEEF